MESIIEYLKQKYAPLSIIVYGSYASGTNDASSDFDALVISASHAQCRDTSIVDGVPLDVFIYPAAYFLSGYNPDDFIQVFDGKIIMDSMELAQSLQSRVLKRLESRPGKPKAGIQADVDWCAKMLKRASRGDTEGMYRWHWLLTDSLEIYCDIMQHPYLGPKKALHWLENTHPEAFSCYALALQSFDLASLSGWIGCVLAAGSMAVEADQSNQPNQPN